MNLLEWVSSLSGVWLPALQMKSNRMQRPNPNIPKAKGKVADLYRFFQKLRRNLLSLSEKVPLFNSMLILLFVLHFLLVHLNSGGKVPLLCE